MMISGAAMLRAWKVLTDVNKQLVGGDGHGFSTPILDYYYIFQNLYIFCTNISKPSNNILPFLKRRLRCTTLVRMTVGVEAAAGDAHMSMFASHLDGPCSPLFLTPMYLSIPQRGLPCYVPLPVTPTARPQTQLT